MKNKEHLILKYLFDNGVLPFYNKQIIFPINDKVPYYVKYDINEIGNFVIEMITGKPEYRKKGYGSQVMLKIIEASNKTNTIIELEIGVIGGSGIIGKNSPNNITGILSSKRKNKIPVKLLSEWYKKFGFEENGKNNIGNTLMIYTPNK